MDKTKATATQKAPEESYWRNFPLFEAALSSENPPVLKKVEATCRALDALISGGSPADRDRAQSAMSAYAKALELYTNLSAARDKAMEQLAQKSRR